MNERCCYIQYSLLYSLILYGYYCILFTYSNSRHLYKYVSILYNLFYTYVYNLCILFCDAFDI